METNNNGYIPLWRKIQDNFLWQKPRIFSEAEAWIDVLMEVRYLRTPKVVTINSHTLTCNYAESLYSLDTWAERWQWDKTKVWRFFRRLEKEDMVAVKNEEITTRLKVCNYENYDIKNDLNETPKPLKTPELTAVSETAVTANETLNTPQIKDLQQPVKRQVKPKEERKKFFCQTSNEARLSNLLLTLILEHLPKFKIAELSRPNSKNSLLQKWALHIDHLIRLNKRTPEQIEKVIRWCQRDDFWQNNILSTKKLRKQFDQLELKMGKQSPPEPLKVDADGLTPRQRMKEQIERNQGNGK